MIDRKSLYILIAVFLFSFSLSQKIDSFKIKRKQKNTSILESYKLGKKYKYLSLFPSLSYDIINKSFNVGLSLSNFTNYMQQRQRNKIELASLEQKLNEKLEKEMEDIFLKIDAFFIEKKSLKNDLKAFKIDSLLFDIKQKKHENHEITTEDFLREKRAFFLKRNALKKRRLKLKLEAKKINLKIKSDTVSASL